MVRSAKSAARLARSPSVRARPAPPAGRQVPPELAELAGAVRAPATSEVGWPRAGERLAAARAGLVREAEEKQEPGELGERLTPRGRAGTSEGVRGPVPGRTARARAPGAAGPRQVAEDHIATVPMARDADQQATRSPAASAWRSCSSASVRARATSPRFRWKANSPYSAGRSSSACRPPSCRSRGPAVGGARRLVRLAVRGDQSGAEGRLEDRFAVVAIGPVREAGQQLQALPKWAAASATAARDGPPPAACQWSTASANSSASSQCRASSSGCVRRLAGSASAPRRSGRGCAGACS